MYLDVRRDQFFIFYFLVYIPHISSHNSSKHFEEQYIINVHGVNVPSLPNVQNNPFKILMEQTFIANLFKYKIIFNFGIYFYRRLQNMKTQI
jgi:hypothetical protein